MELRPLAFNQDHAATGQQGPWGSPRRGRDPGPACVRSGPPVLPAPRPPPPAVLGAAAEMCSGVLRRSPSLHPDARLVAEGPLVAQNTFVEQVDEAGEDTVPLT